MKKGRAIIASSGSALGLTLVWLAGETFASEMPGTAMLVGLVGFLALVVCVGLLFYVFHK